MSHSLSSAALSNRLSGISGGYFIGYENQSFEPPADEAYLVESIQPAASLPIGPNADSSTLFEGVFQVLCYAPKGLGKGLAFQAAEAVLARFPRGLRVTYATQATTVRRAEQNTGFFSGDRFVVPVSIYYRAAA